MDEKNDEIKRPELQIVEIDGQNYIEISKDQMEYFKNNCSQSIFRPTPKSVGPKNVLEYKVDRFRLIHKTVKLGIVYKILNFIKKKLSHILIRNVDDMPNEWFNNHHRMFYNCWQVALKDMWTKKYCPNYKQIHGSYEQLLSKVKNSHEGRKLLIDIWMTEIMEDTVDREWLNFFMLRLYHEMHDFYNGTGVPTKVPKVGEYPIYFSLQDGDPIYFINNMYRKKYTPKVEE
jgi:hypothetical protein